MNDQLVTKALRDACEKAGSQRAWATANLLSAAYVNDVLNGKREPGTRLLAALGIERVVTYRWVDND